MARAGRLVCVRREQYPAEDGAWPMNVDVALFASLASFQPDGMPGRHARVIEFPDGSSVGGVIAELGLPDEPRVVFVNGRHADDDVALSSGDRLAIFPPVGGG